mmetsp:Transcript_25039/g.61023  ORF Transcript_25039/g.61023 Transcript_25039/m.61023 type:complete len:216 (-) Transcript_25039:41-688(-)
MGMAGQRAEGEGWVLRVLFGGRRFVGLGLAVGVCGGRGGVLRVEHLLHKLLGAVVLLLELFRRVGVLELDGQHAFVALLVRIVHRRPHPRTVRPHVRLELHRRVYVVVQADLLGLVAPHQQTDLLVLLVLQKLHIPDPALLPLCPVCTIPVQLRPHLVQHLLVLLPRTRLLLRQLHHRRKLCSGLLLRYNLVVLAGTHNGRRRRRNRLSLGVPRH